MYHLPGSGRISLCSVGIFLSMVDSITFQTVLLTTISDYMVHNVTADIIAHQVLLNRVPEQATEDSVKYQIYY